MSDTTKPKLHRRQLACIALMGPDGSGKTAMAEYLEHNLELAEMTGFCTFQRQKLIGVDHQPADPERTINHYALPPHNVLFSIVKLILRSYKWWRMYHTSIAQSRQKDCVTLLDRFLLLDMWIDPLRYRYHAPLGLVEWAIKILPHPDLIFILDAPVIVLLERKLETPAELLAKNRERYLHIPDFLPGSHVIDTNQPIEQSAQAVIRHIHAYQAGSDGVDGRGRTYAP